ncbi:hypothetical protein Bca4012_093111 [Brassica carinata]
MKGLEGGGFIMQGLGKSIECWMVLGLGVAGGRGGGSDGKSISEVGGRGRLTDNEKFFTSHGPIYDKYEKYNDDDAVFDEEEHTSKDILKNWIGDPIYDESDDEIIELAQAEFATIISGFAFKIKEKEDLESDLEKQSINYALWEKDESVVLPCYGTVKFLDYEKQVGFYFSRDCRQRKSKPPDPTQSKSGHWKQRLSCVSWKVYAMGVSSYMFRHVDSTDEYICFSCKIHGKVEESHVFVKTSTCTSLLPCCFPPKVGT